MAIYEIQWKPSAVKELKKIDSKTVPRIIKVVESLSSNPFPSGVRKLYSSEHAYRIRVGDYRVIYTVFERRLVIEVVRVRHRKDVYRK